MSKNVKVTFDYLFYFSNGHIMFLQLVMDVAVNLKVRRLTEK